MTEVKEAIENTATSPVVEAPAAPAPPVDKPVDASAPASPEKDKASEQAPVAEGPSDDWRVKGANGDDKLLKRLERFNSPADVFKSYVEMEKKLSSAKIRNELPKDATPEQLTAWRKAEGLPLEPKDYDLTLDNGVVIGEDDRPMVDKFLANMHDKNAPPSAVKAALTTYYDLVEEAKQARAKADADAQAASRQELMKEWGPEYQANFNNLQAMLEQAPSSVREKLEGARMADGTPLGYDPDMVRWMAGQARELYPLATIAPGGGSAAYDALKAEMKAIEAKQHTTDYTAADRARYVELVGMEMKHKSRGA